MSTIPFLPVETLLMTGNYLGKLHQAFDNAFTVDTAPWKPAARRYHIWDGKQAMDIQPFVAGLPTQDNKQARVSSILKAFHEELPRLRNTLRSGVCHNDFNDANIVCDDNMRVSGVIDFGDAVET